MANYLTNDTELTAIANAIRTKGGTSEQLEYPDGFVSAIEDIQTGGETQALTVSQNGTYTAPTGIAYNPVTVNVPTQDVEIIDTVDEHGGTIRTINTGGQVVFIDYDGTIVATKSKSEINAMSSDSDLPANPTHTGLTSQGWNWTVAQLKTQLTAMPDQKVYVGQMYVTQSGATEIDVSMQKGRLAPILTICVNGTVTVDWGDNTTPDTVTGTSETTRKAVSHTYASEGNYTISISNTSGTYSFYGDSNGKYTLLRKNITGNENRTYANCVQEIRLGNGISYIRAYAFYNCSSLSSVTIPSGVTIIGSNAFYCCSSISSITIPSSVTSIAAGTFSNCYSLSSITIPSNVTSIGDSAFYYCYSLSNITIPSNVTSIGDSAFYYCYSLSNITIPSGVTSIGSSAFINCSSISSITIPSSVTSIAAGTFSNCYSLSSITIPSNVTSIGDSAFYYCYSLSNITIPSGVTSIGTSAFQNCYSLASITIPSSVTSIGTSAFQYCYSITSITIPSNVTSIGNSTFYQCYSLASITIPSGVTSIGNSAFNRCYSLTSITIPSDVTSIGNNAFNSCYGAAEYHLLPTTVPTLGTTAFANIVSDCKIYVPYSADHSILNAYQTATNWSAYASYMQEEPQ